MQKTVAFITGLLVLVHSGLGCCALDADHHGEVGGQSSQVAAADHAFRIDPAEGGRPGHEHECCHLTCQWVAPSSVDRVDGPQRDFVIGSAPAHVFATCIAFAAAPVGTEGPPGAAPPVRRHLQLGVLLI
jgi:hypothetical protein